MDPLRQRALELAKNLPLTPTNLSRVARSANDEAARWAFGQWELRKRAKAKFELADEMLFTREALEQATHEKVAAYHASRFPGGQVFDLTTGIGADLIAMARVGIATGYDLDAERVEYARHNLEVHGLAAEVRVGDSLEGAWDYAFADPARRVEGRRTLDLDEFSPRPRELASRMAEIRLGGIKLSPMLPDSALESLGPCLEFVSFGGECREALIWTGREAEGGRWAVHVETGSRLAAEAAPVRVGEAGEYLFEADPAAIRAHCLGTLAQQFGLEGLGDSNGYLTGSEPVESPWLKAYRILYSGKGDLATTKAELKRLGAARPVLKQRGAGVDLPKLAKQLPASGERAVCLAIWTVGNSLKHTILEPSGTE